MTQSRVFFKKNDEGSRLVLGSGLSFLYAFLVLKSAKGKDLTPLRTPYSFFAPLKASSTRSTAAAWPGCFSGFHDFIKSKRAPSM